MTLLDFTTAGAIGAVSGLPMIGAYEMMRWLKRMEWSEQRYENILTRFPDRMEAVALSNEK